jgi:flagellar motility protein MotE (MotC chaperone)
MSKPSNEFEAIHQQVWDKLDSSNRQLYFLKRENRDLKKELRDIKKDLRKLRKTKGTLKYSR